MSNIVSFQVEDILEMKKSHPCGGNRLKVLKTGTDIHVLCEKCGHDMVVNRLKLEKNIKKVISVKQ